MNFYDLLSILKSRKWLVIGGVLFALIVGVVLTLLMPKSYLAKTTLVINYKGVDPVTGLSLPAQLMPGYIPTQVDIINSDVVALKVVKNLNLSSSPSAIAQFKDEAKGEGDIDVWLSELIRKKLFVKPSRESSVITIGYESPNPVFSALIANEYAKSYKEISLNLKTEPSQRATTYLTSQTDQLRNKVVAAQQKLSQYQQENNITSFVENFDVENAKLNELSTQLSVAESQAIEASTRSKSAKKSGIQAPDISTNPVVQNLKMQLTAAQAKLADLSQVLSSNHPKVVAAQAELDKIKIALNQEVSNSEVGVSESSDINRQRVTQLKAAVAQQKLKLLSLNKSRDQLNILQKDVENAQTSLNAALQRLNQTSLEGSSNENEISILGAATPPLTATSPSLTKNLSIALLLGFFLSLLTAIILEMMNRKIRHPDELMVLTGIPLIAYIDGSESKLVKSRSVKRHFLLN